MPYNINAKSITEYLGYAVFAGHDLYDRHLNELHVLLCCALKRPLRRDLSNQQHPDHLQKIAHACPGDPAWLHQALKNGETVYNFEPRASLETKIYHVIDWLDAALRHDEPWLSDCDQLGRPHKLMKLGSVDQAVAEADKAMRRAAANPVGALGPDHTEPVKTFPDGAAIVKLLTVRALHAESCAMRHCIGNGAYDQKLTDQSHSYYSLRCPSGKAHATMEVREKDNALLQCQGKQNTQPAAKYMPYIKEFVQERGFDISACPQTGLIKQHGRYFDVANLPENFRYDGNLDLSGSRLQSLPNGLHITGTLDIQESAIRRLPERLTVENNLFADLSSLEYIPPDIKIGNTLSLVNCPITTLPDNLRVPGVLDLHGTRITALPRGLAIGSDLDLQCSRIKTLPIDIRIGNELDLRECQLDALPERLRIPGHLNIQNCTIGTLPKSMTVGGRVFVNENTRLPEVPPYFSGKLYRAGTGTQAPPDMVLNASYARAPTPRRARPTPEAEIEF